MLIRYALQKDSNMAYTSGRLERAQALFPGIEQRIYNFLQRHHPGAPYGHEIDGNTGDDGDKNQAQPVSNDLKIEHSAEGNSDGVKSNSDHISESNEDDGFVLLDGYPSETLEPNDGEFTNEQYMTMTRSNHDGEQGASKEHNSNAVKKIDPRTISKPRKRKCISCQDLGTDCSFATDADQISFPCETCAFAGIECVLISEPTVSPPAKKRKLSHEEDEYGYCSPPMVRRASS